MAAQGWFAPTSRDKPCGRPRREARPLPGRRRQGGRGGVPHAHACSPILLKLVLSHLAAGTGLAGANIRERTLRLLLACSSSNLAAASCATRSERSSSSVRWGVIAGVGVGASAAKIEFGRSRGRGGGAPCAPFDLHLKEFALVAPTLAVTGVPCVAAVSRSAGTYMHVCHACAGRC